MTKDQVFPTGVGPITIERVRPTVPMMIDLATGEHTITTTHKLSKQFLMDVLCTICEGGSNYWSDFVASKWEGEGPARGYTEAKMLYDDPEQDEGNRRGRFTMGLAQVATGIQLILEKFCIEGCDDKHNLAQEIKGRIATLDAGNIDGEAADCIAQVALFGEIVYG